MKSRLSLSILLLVCLACIARAESVWVEGESAAKTNLVANGWLKGDTKLLSGGDALACLNNPQNLPSPAFVFWKLTVPADGRYQVYFRHGYQSHTGKMRYRLIALGADGEPITKPADDEGWVQFDLSAKTMDRKEIGQFRTIEWTQQAPADLKTGTYQLELQVQGPNPSHEAEGDNALIWTVIDCLCLTTDPFTPNGSNKPGEKPAE